MTSLKRKLSVVGGCAALTAVGFIVVPPIINWASRKLYRVGSTTDDIDFDDLGPEIVKKSDLQDDED